MFVTFMDWRVHKERKKRFFCLTQDKNIKYYNGWVDKKQFYNTILKMYKLLASQSDFSSYFSFQYASARKDVRANLFG